MSGPIYHRLVTIEYDDEKQKFKFFSNAKSCDIAKVIRARFRIADGTKFFLNDSDGDTVTTDATLPTGNYTLHIVDTRAEIAKSIPTVQGHMISQPTRAVVWLLTIHKVKFNFEDINIFTGEHKSTKYVKTNPNGLVPTLVESDGFVLHESNAILAYLCDKYGWAEWYPTELRARGRVDQYLHWHHHNVRIATTEILVPGLNEKKGILKAEEAKAKIDNGTTKLKNALQLLNDHYLKEFKWIGGKNPSIADLNAFCEIGQLKHLGLFDFSNYPNVQRWLTQMEGCPAHNEVHKGLFAFRDSMKKGA